MIQAVTESLAILTSGLLAGLYVAWSCSVLPGLAATDDRVFVTAMTAINDAVRNPSFAAGFVGAPVSALALVVVAAGSGEPVRGPVLALVLHLAGLAVTVAVNLRLNDELARGASAPTAARARFLRPWSRWNTVRTWLAVGAVLTLAWPSPGR